MGPTEHITQWWWAAMGRQWAEGRQTPSLSNPTVPSAGQAVMGPAGPMSLRTLPWAARARLVPSNPVSSTSHSPGALFQDHSHPEGSVVPWPLSWAWLLNGLSKPAAWREALCYSMPGPRAAGCGPRTRA